MPSRQTQEQFIGRAKQKHGSLYDYSLVNYTHYLPTYQQWKSTLVKSDIGKWCYFACGCHQGFFDTKEQLDALLIALDYPAYLCTR